MSQIHDFNTCDIFIIITTNTESPHSESGE